MLNPLPKYVASRSLHGDLDWNATAIAGDAVDGVARLKAELARDLVMSGCGELARLLILRGLVDELRFWIHPALLRFEPLIGSGFTVSRVFSDLGQRVGRRARVTQR